MNVHAEEPHELDAVHVTKVVPVVNVDPDAGTHATVAAGVPVEVGVANVATWLSHCVMSEGQAPIMGLSLIVTLKVHDEDPQVFVAVQVTTVVPVVNVVPDAGEQTTIGEVPVAAGSVQVAMWLSHWLISEGHAPITGAMQLI